MYWLKLVLYMVILVIYVLGTCKLIMDKKDKFVLPFIVFCLLLMGIMYL